MQEIFKDHLHVISYNTKHLFPAVTNCDYLANNFFFFFEKTN
jgi:hypothetical protein